MVIMRNGWLTTELAVGSLEVDPTLWTAYEELCELGADIDASRFFGAATYLNSGTRGA